MFQGIEYVLAVYEAQSFSKAAKKLFISQPSLSANIKRIEKRMGMEIFDRTTIPLKLTEFGQEYVKTAQALKRIEQDFMNYMSDYSGLQRGRLTIGGSSLYASLILPRLMAEFTRLYPKLELDLFEETSLNLETLLRDGKIDILLDNSALDPQIFQSQPLRQECLLLAVPKSFGVNQGLEAHQISASLIKADSADWRAIPPVPLKVFNKEAFVLLKEDNDSGARARHICERNQVTPQVVFNVEQQLTAYNITASGMAISFVGDTLVSRVTIHEGIHYYRIDDPEARRQIAFYWKKDRYQSKAMEAFLALSKTPFPDPRVDLR